MKRGNRNPIKEKDSTETQRPGGGAKEKGRKTNWDGGTQGRERKTERQRERHTERERDREREREQE
jgi:hypothetical protein